MIAGRGTDFGNFVKEGRNRCDRREKATEKGQTFLSAQTSKFRTRLTHPRSFSAIEGILAELGSLGLDSRESDRLPDGGVRGSPFDSSVLIPSVLPSSGGVFGDRPRSKELAFRKFEAPIESVCRGDPVGGGVAAFDRS